MKKILITGGAGFIGSHTAVALHESGYLPVIVDNFSNSEKSVLDGIAHITGERFPFYEGDCLDQNFMEGVFEKEGGIVGVIHFAAYKSVNESMEKPVEYYQNNLGSLFVLLRVMLKYNVAPLVFSSSCTVYGSPDTCPVDETAPMKDTPSPYGKTKQLCEKILADVVERGQPLRAVSLRYFNPIGAHPTGFIGELPIGVPNNLVPFVAQTAAGIREQLTVFGEDYDTPDGTCIRDYIHVMDLAHAHVKAIEFIEKVDAAHCYEIFNVGTGNGNTVMEVVKAFEGVNGLKLNYTIGPRRPGDVEKVYANCERVHNVMGWQAERSLDDSLKDAWNWQQKLSS